MATTKKPSDDRIAYLDGLRGIAILWVAGYHLLARWSTLFPFGDAHSGFLLAKHGWLGVNLFFMISGYVIFLTLERCRSFPEFLLRRWLRLFPAMLVVSAFVWATLPLLPERPLPPPGPWDFVPGLLLVAPGWINAVAGTHLLVAEGTFWSLFVEIEFYVFFGALWFLLGRRAALWGMVAVFAVAVAAKVGNHYRPVEPFATLKSLAIDLLSLQYAGWFLLGALVKHLQRGASALLVAALLALAVVDIAYAQLWRPPGSVAAAVACVGVFCLAPLVPRLRRILSAKPLLAMGFLSYPFYLVHEGMSVAIARKLFRHFPAIPSLLPAGIAFLCAASVAWCIARYAEPPLRRLLQRWTEPLMRRVA